MTDHERTGIPAVQGAGDLLGYPDRDAEAEVLPEHERREDRTVGGGGTLDGDAQGPEADDDQADVVDEPDELNPTTHLPG